MRVVLDPDLFAAGSPFDFQLINLLTTAVGRPHQVLVDGGDAGEGLRDAWLARREAALRAPLQTLFENAFSSGFIQHPPGVTVHVSATHPEQVLSGNEAIAGLVRAHTLLTTPLGVLLENKVNDSAFLRLVTPRGPVRDELEDAISKDWIGFKHGAGGDLVQQLNGLDPWKRLRTWAMCDAESWDPAAKHAQVVGIERAAAKAPAVPLEVLKRRAIENYLPMPALDAWIGRIQGKQYHSQAAACVGALRALDSHGALFPLRHHFHYEKGFGHLPADIPPEYDPFRADPALSRGMGRQVKGVWLENLNARGTADHLLKDEWLAADGQDDEVKRIIASLRARL